MSKLKMSPALAKKVHDMREKHISYAVIVKEIGVKRSSLQNYYYKWLSRTGRKAWGVE